MIAALVCGRAESQPFPGRNIFPLMGRPLMVYPLLAAIHSKEVTNTFLSTDDEDMAVIGQHYGAEVIKRPAKLVGANGTLEEVLEHGYKEVISRLGDDLESLVVLLANAPTVTSDLIDHGLEILRGDSKLDAVMTVSLHNEFSPSYALQLTDDGGVQPYLEPSREGTPDVYFNWRFANGLVLDEGNLGSRFTQVYAVTIGGGTLNGQAVDGRGNVASSSSTKITF